jgi:hypothetical protein
VTSKDPVSFIGQLRRCYDDIGELCTSSVRHDVSLLRVLGAGAKSGLEAQRPQHIHEVALVSKGVEQAATILPRVTIMNAADPIESTSGFSWAKR